jgi:proline dehydrogenase
VATSKALGYNLGIKLIRGAYLNEERSIAAANGLESPVWDELQQTHDCYNSSMLHVIENLTPQGMLMVASHNADSVELAKKKLADLAITDDRVRFAQLKAFSDHLTGQLSSEAFKVYKYLPYGPMEEVMPYLVRRGQESKQVVREQVYQNKFLRQEILRRLNPLNKLK